MAKQDKLRKAAVRIGAAVGRADRTAQKVHKASVVARQELDNLTQQIDALKRRLVKTTKRLRKALA